MAAVPPNDPWPLPELTRARRAIVVVDVVESVRLMQEDEAGFIDRWRRFVHEVRSEVLPKHGGRMVKSLGDGMLLEFRQVPDAARAALVMQALAQPSSGLDLRIGMHVSEVSIDDSDVFGTGVNLAARVATLAAPGLIAVTCEVRDELVDGLDVEVTDMGACWLKHLAAPVHAFSLRQAGPLQAPDPLTAAGEISMTLAVLPLSCSAGSANHGSLGDFIADGLIAVFSLAPELKVLSRLCTRAVNERSIGAVEAGRLLGAKYLLSGAYAVDRSDMIIDVELADAQDGRVIWAGRQRCAVDDLFAHPSTPIERLAGDAHRALLDSESRRVKSRPLPNLASYSLLLGSIGLLHRTTQADFDQAHKALEALIQREPRHGAGFTWLTKWHFLRMIRGLAPSPQREREEAGRRAEEALQRDENGATAWALRGLVYAYNGHDLARTEAALQRAIELNPSESLAWLYMGTLRSWQGRGQEAVQAAQRALALSPLDPMRYYFESLAAAAMLADSRHEEAISLARRSLRVHGGHTPTCRVLTIAQALSGRMDEARETMALMRAAEPGLTVGAYLERYPGRDAAHALSYADALRAAGLPD